MIGALGVATALLFGLLNRAEPVQNVWAVAVPVAATAAVMIVLVFWAIQRGESAGLAQHMLIGALEAAGEGRLVTTLNGRVLFCNPAFRWLSGIHGTRALVSLSDLRCEDAGVRDALLALWDAVGDDGRPHQCDLPIHAADGTPIGWRQLALQPMPSRPDHLLWSITDITAHRGQIQALTDDLARVLDLMEQAPTGLFSLDADGRFRFANQAAEQLLGIEPGGLAGTGRRLLDFLAEPPERPMPPFDPLGLEPPAAAATAGDGLVAKLAHPTLSRSLTPRTPPPGRVKLRSDSGDMIDVRIDQSVHRDADGRALWTRATVWPVSQGDDYEDMLRVSEHRFQRIFEEAPVGIVETDTKGLITACNGAFREMVHPMRGRLVGRAVADLIAPEDRSKIDRGLAALAVSTAAATPTEVRLEGDGETVAVLYVSLNDDAVGAPAGYILHFIDNTEQRKLELQFAHSQKMQAVGQLAGGVAHDFNNLLTAMIGFCDLLLIRHRPGEQSFADIMQIKQTASRAANLVRQLLAFSRQQALMPRVLDITEVLAELSYMIRRLIGENIDLRMTHGRDLKLIKVDLGQLEQVIINLAVNARDAMVAQAGAAPGAAPGGVGAGVLSIATANETVTRPRRRQGEEIPAGDYVKIEVTDTGTGIPADILERIFDPFFSTKEAGSGTGLGLSTVYGIVKQTGGFILVDTEPGRGSCFSILLPAHETPPPKPEDARARDKAEARPRDLTGRGTVLLVEDEDPVRRFSARALRNKGYNVVEAPSGQAALDVIAAGDTAIDLMVSDVVMPKMDGPTLVARVRESHPDMKVVFISGYAEDTFRERLGSDDGIHFLPKPFSLKQLAGKVKEIMDGPET